MGVRLWRGGGGGLERDAAGAYMLRCCSLSAASLAAMSRVRRTCDAEGVVRGRGGELVEEEGAHTVKAVFFGFGLGGKSLGALVAKSLNV